MLEHLFSQSQTKLDELISLHAISDDLQNSAQIRPLVTAMAMSEFVTQQLQKHGDIDFVMLAKNPTIDAWWALLSREVQ